MKIAFFFLLIWAGCFLLAGQQSLIDHDWSFGIIELLWAILLIMAALMADEQCNRQKMRERNK